MADLRRRGADADLQGAVCGAVETVAGGAGFNHDLQDGTGTAVLHGWRAMTIDIDIDIKPQLIRYPAIDPASFEAAVLEFCKANP